MSRKKIKKELVRRNISMYDPMGIYGRGLTKNQKEGMTRRMKVEYMSPPPVRINQQLLAEYRKTLIHYGIPTCFHEKLVQCTVPCNAGTDIEKYIASDYFKSTLDSMNIRYMGYVVDSIIIRKGTNNTFPSAFSYTYYFFDQYWTESYVPTPSGEISSVMNDFVMQCPTKVNENYLTFIYPLPDNSNTNWQPMPDYKRIDNSSSVASTQVKVGESMPFAMYPEKGYTMAGNYGRGLTISYTSNASFDIIFNFRVIY